MSGEEKRSLHDNATRAVDGGDASSAPALQDPFSATTVTVKPHGEGNEPMVATSSTADMRPREAVIRGNATAAVAPPAESAGAYARGASIGRYMVLNRLGQGAMGAVYTAYDPELDRRVAVKLLHTALASESGKKRLVREARALAKLSHPNVVHVYDAGEHDGDVFIAMELVEGRSLKEWVRGTANADPPPTLKSEPRPSWKDVLRAYLDAARGLLAAHEQALIHRDVKPANILIGKDGRVRVADFGLAAVHEPLTDDASGDCAAADEPPGEPAASSSSQQGGFDERLTATGAITGTPAFMAPEQYRRAKLGPAADQYGLCVSLYEGLYGALPFTADAHAERLAVLLQLYQRKMNEKPAPPPEGTPVPAWVHNALVRGLSPRPEDRYPSLEALVTALSDDPDARWRARRRVIGAAAGAVVLAGVALAGWVQSGVFRDPCGDLGRELAGAWDETVKGKVRAALLGTQRSYAGTTAERVAAVLDRYAGQWVQMRTEVCRASREETGEQRRSVLTLRDLCLLRRHGQLRALTEVLAAGPDAQVLDKAAQAAEGLYPIAYCADEKALTARVPPPEDPALRARVEALQPRIDRLEAIYTAGKYKEGLAEGGPLLADVEGLAYAPLRAQVIYWMGRLREGDGDYDGARSMLREALFLAAEGKDHVLATWAAGWLLLVVGNRQLRFDEARSLMEWAPLIVSRTGDSLAHTEWLNSQAMVLKDMGRYEEAKAWHERALSIREQALGPDHPDVAMSLNDLAVVLRQMGRYEEAKALYERALSIWEKALGPDHPHVAMLLNNLANMLDDMGRYEEAKALYERALSIWEKSLGPDHPDVAIALNNLANVLNNMHRYEEAKARIERALSIWEKALGPDHPDVAEALTNLGRILVHRGELDVAAGRLERALSIGEKALGESHRNLAATLLGLGELALARRAPAEAESVLERALSLDSPVLRAEVQLTLAQALWTTGKDRPRAIALATQACEHAGRIGHEPHLAKTTGWLAEHRLP
jgi:serine/threonine-protein kinase